MSAASRSAARVQAAEASAADGGGVVEGLVALLEGQPGGGEVGVDAVLVAAVQAVDVGKHEWRHGVQLRLDVVLQLNGPVDRLPLQDLGSSLRVRGAHAFQKVDVDSLDAGGRGAHVPVPVAPSSSSSSAPGGGDGGRCGRCLNELQARWLTHDLPRREVFVAFLEVQLKLTRVEYRILLLLLLPFLFTVFSHK